VCAMVHAETHRIEMMHQQAEQMQAQQVTPGQDDDIQVGGEQVDRSQAAGGPV